MVKATRVSTVTRYANSTIATIASKEKSKSGPTEKANRPRAILSTTGLSGIHRLFQERPFCFRQASTIQQVYVTNQWEARGEKEDHGLSKRERNQQVVAGTDLQPHTGHPLPLRHAPPSALERKPRGVPMGQLLQGHRGGKHH